MKNCILLFTVMFAFSGVYAQDLAGRKIVQGSVSINMISGEGGSTNFYDISLRYGKIRENNTYLAWGGSFSGNTNTSTSNNIRFNQYLLGPSAEFGKFIPIVDKFYLAPYLGGTLQGAFGDEFGGRIAAYVVPIRFIYNLSNNFMLSSSFGSASMNFSKIGKNTQFSLSGNLTNNSGFGVFYTFK